MIKLKYDADLNEIGLEKNETSWQIDSSTNVRLEMMPG